MNAKSFQFIRNAGLVAGAVVALNCTGLSGADKTTIPSDAFPNFDSYIKLTGQAAAITGDGAAFQSRAAQSQNGGVGIEDFHYSQDLSKDLTVTSDAHAMTGIDDYLASLSFVKNEVGKFDIGYKNFTTFYDGVGGFFPATNYLSTLSQEVLKLKRAKFWVDATIALPNMPVFTIKYTNELRNGQKDSTIWGSTDNTGVPYALAPLVISDIRKGVAAWYDIGERHENIEASVKHTVKNVTASVTYFHDTTNNLDTRFFTNFPGEVIPWSIQSLSTSAANIAKSKAPYTSLGNEADVYETDGMATTTNGVNGLVEVALRDNLKLVATGSYQKVNNDITGNRPLVTSTPSAVGTVLVTTTSWNNLTGLASVEEANGGLSLNWNATQDLFLKLGVKAGDEYMHSNNAYNVTAAALNTATGVVTTTITPRVGYEKRHNNQNTPVAELRYTGIKNVSFYAYGSKRTDTGLEKNCASYNPLTATQSTLGNNNTSDDKLDYTVGANWRVSNALTLRGEYFDKHHKVGYVGFDSLTLNLDPTHSDVGDNYLYDTTTKGFKLSAILKPVETMAFTTRFIDQRVTADVTGYLPTFPANPSCDSKNYSINETIDFNPSKLVYAQASVNLVFGTISTLYPNQGTYVPATSTTNAYNLNNEIQNSNNNYVTYTMLVGFVADKHTDIQLQYIDYRANDGNAFLMPYSMAYGVNCHDYSTTLGVKHQFNDKLVMNAKIGYTRSSNDTTGGRTNYNGPLAYVSFDHAL